MGGALESPRTQGPGERVHRAPQLPQDGFCGLGSAVRACGPDTAEPPGAHPGSANASYHAGNRAGARATGPVRESLARRRPRGEGTPGKPRCPNSGDGGSVPGSGGGGTQAGEPRRSLTRNGADTTYHSPCRRTAPPRTRLRAEIGALVLEFWALPAHAPCLGGVGAPGQPVCRVAAGEYH